MTEHEVRQKIYSLQLKHASKLVLLGILSRVSWDTWSGQVSANDISQLMNIPLRTVKSAIKDLSALGYIERNAQLRAPAQHHRAQTKLVVSKVCKNCTSAKTAPVQKLHPPSAEIAPPLVQELHPPSAETAPPLVQELHPITIEESIEVSIEDKQYTREPQRTPQAAPQPQAFVWPPPVETIADQEEKIRVSLNKEKEERDKARAHLSPERRAYEDQINHNQAFLRNSYK